MSLDNILLIGAAISFGLAAAGVQVGRLNLMGLGLLLWTLAALI